MMKGTRLRILKQIRLLQTEGKDQGISVKYDQQNLEHILVSMEGPVGTLYEGGIFFMDFQLTQFPWKAPKCHFKTPIYNPVIERTGLVHCCFDFREQWSPAINMMRIVNKYKQYFYVQNINSNSCFGNDDLHNQFLHNNQQFRRKAKQWTKKYATRLSTYNNVLDFLEQGEDVEILDLNTTNYFCLLQPVKDEDCIKLSQAYLPNLKVLRINMEKVSDVGYSQLFQPQKWPKLNQLSLKSNGKIKQLGKYFRIPCWTNLKKLKIQNIKGGSYAIKSLVKCTWPQLRSLQLDFYYLTMQMLQILRLADWAQLEELNLGYVNISSIGLFYLFSANYKQLKQLRVNIGFKDYKNSLLFQPEFYRLLNVSKQI